MPGGLPKESRKPVEIDFIGEKSEGVSVEDDANDSSSEENSLFGIPFGGGDSGDKNTTPQITVEQTASMFIIFGASGILAIVCQVLLRFYNSMILKLPPIADKKEVKNELLSRKLDALSCKIDQLMLDRRKEWIERGSRDGLDICVSNDPAMVLTKVSKDFTKKYSTEISCVQESRFEV